MDNEPIFECSFTYHNGTPVFSSTGGGWLSREIRRVFGALYLRNQQMWIFPAFYPYVEDVLSDFTIVFGERICFDQKAHDWIWNKRWIHSGIVPDFQYVMQPFLHQQEALEFALQHLRCGIFYDMGLGKSKTVVDLIRHEHCRALILSPVVGVAMWLAEIEKHSAGALRAIGVSGSPANKKRAIITACTEPEVSILVVSYDTAKRCVADLLGFDYQLIVADESHYLRSNNSARTKAIVQLASKATRRIVLSGTPTLGNPLHLYGQLAFLAPYIPAKDFWTFRSMYTITSPYNARIITGYKNLDMLRLRLARVSIRRTKEECLDLPERTIIDIPFQVEGVQRETYNQLVADSTKLLAKGELYEAPHAAAVLQKLLQVLSGFFITPLPNICDNCVDLKACVANSVKPYTHACRVAQTPPEQRVEWLPNNPKRTALAGLLDSILVEKRNKVIIWCHFIAELDSVETLLTEQDIEYVRIDGSNSDKAQETATLFNANPKVRVYLAQIATGVAITLTSATYMIYYGVSYKLDEYLQSMDRNYRIGQKAPVFVYRLTSPRSVLEYVFRALAQKINIADSLTNRIDCLLCSRSLDCMAAGTRPFDKGCVYPSRVVRQITHPVQL